MTAAQASTAGARTDRTADRARPSILPPLHAWLLPLTPLLPLYASNPGRVPFDDLLWIGGPALAIYLAAYLAVRRLAGGGALAGIVMAILLLAGTHGALSLPSAIAVPGAIALAAAGILCAVKLRDSRGTIDNMLSAVAAALVAMPLYQIATDPGWRVRAEIAAVAESAFPPLPSPAAAADKRDIYYIVFDRYARADQLHGVYGYDNSAFIAALRRRGFQVTDESYANYQRTAHSLASSLNLDYLTALETPVSDRSGDWVPIYSLLQNFRLQSFLEEQGYEFHYFGSWWTPTRRNRHAGFNHSYRAWPELARVAFENSALGMTAQRLGIRAVDPLAIQCDRPKHQFATLGDLAGREGPQFVFAHFLVPHPPFVLDETGACMGVAKALSRSRAENYVGQVKWTNGRILAWLDRLTAAAGPKPIVVIQSDEGPWPARLAGDEVTRLGQDVSSADWTRIPPAELREKMGILNAVYLPDRPDVKLASDAAPVNTFRTILREYFSVDLPDLPVRQFVFVDDNHLYRFSEVTETLKR